MARTYAQSFVGNRVDYGMDKEDLTLEQRFQLNFDLRDEESHAYYKIN